MAPEHFEQIYVLRTPYDGISVTGIVVEHANDLIYFKKCVDMQQKYVTDIVLITQVLFHLSIKP